MKFLLFSLLVVSILYSDYILLVPGESNKYYDIAKIESYVMTNTSLTNTEFKSVTFEKFNYGDFVSIFNFKFKNEPTNYQTNLIYMCVSNNTILITNILFQRYREFYLNSGVRYTNAPGITNYILSNILTSYSGELYITFEGCYYGTGTTAYMDYGIYTNNVKVRERRVGCAAAGNTDVLFFSVSVPVYVISNAIISARIATYGNSGANSVIYETALKLRGEF